MMNLRKSEERGHFNHGWLKSAHTFSFAGYFDPKHVHFRKLRVINEDKVSPSQGFPLHSHRDMEIISYIVSGSMEHRDSMGNVEILGPGHVQQMTAGRGISHSEYNHSPSDDLHFLQIWVMPERSGLDAGYKIKDFSEAFQSGTPILLVSPDENDDALTINQDLRLYRYQLESEEKASFNLNPGRHVWIQMVKGCMLLDGVSLKAGDGAAVSDQTEIHMHGKEKAEFLLFDLA